MNVQLILSLPSGSVDLNEEVYAADVKIGETMSFSLKTSSPQDKSPPEPPLPLAATKEVCLSVFCDPTQTLALGFCCILLAQNVTISIEERVFLFLFFWSSIVALVSKCLGCSWNQLGRLHGRPPESSQ